MGWEGGRRGREWKSNQQPTGLSSQTVRGLRNAERRLLRSTNDEILSEYFLTLRHTKHAMGREGGREGRPEFTGGDDDDDDVSAKPVHRARTVIRLKSEPDAERNG